jgi:hypothetical protein
MSYPEQLKETTVESFKRMTPEWAQSILEHYSLRLGYGVWTPTRSHQNQCCGLGLYLINKDGYDGKFNDFVHKEWEEHSGWLSGAHGMTRRIANHVGLPYAYAAGLSNGFEQERDSHQVQEPTLETEEERQLYEWGLADGQALIPLVG